MRVDQAHLDKLKDVDWGHDDECRQEDCRGLQKELVEQDVEQVPLQVLAREHVVVGKKDHEGPEEGQGDRTRDGEETRVVTHAYEQVHVVNQHACLVRCKCNCKQALRFACLVTDSVAIDPEGDEEEDGTGDDGVGLPQERPIDQR